MDCWHKSCCTWFTCLFKEKAGIFRPSVCSNFPIQAVKEINSCINLLPYQCIWCLWIVRLETIMKIYVCTQALTQIQPFPCPPGPGGRGLTGGKEGSQRTGCLPEANEKISGSLPGNDWRGAPGPGIRSVRPRCRGCSLRSLRHCQSGKQDKEATVWLGLKPLRCSGW